MAINSGLPSRYEIRTLGMEHLDWCKALIMHSNVFGSPIWAIVYPKNKTHRLYETYKTIDYLVRHQIESGLSLGIFDKEYKYKRSESADAGGKLYWDLTNEDAEEDELLEQMDFPLVSVALAYDRINKLDHARIEPLCRAPCLRAGLRLCSQRREWDHELSIPSGQPGYGQNLCGLEALSECRLSKSQLGGGFRSIICQD